MHQKYVLSIVILFFGFSFILAKKDNKEKRPIATTWAATSNNSLVTRMALLDAVNNGVFTAKTSIPNDLRLVTRELAESYVELQTMTIPNNRLPVKGLFIPADVFYYNELVGMCGVVDGFATLVLLGYPSSADALANYSTGLSGYLSTTFNRNLIVGDRGNGGFYYDYISGNTAVGGTLNLYCNSGGSYGSWYYYPPLNAAVRIIDKTTNPFYEVAEIVFPSGLTNVPICLSVSFAGSTSVNVQAIASEAVSTTVTVYWSAEGNNMGLSIQPNLTINSGQTTSNTVNVEFGVTIFNYAVVINSFSPTNHGTQNYIGTGECGL